MIWLSTGIFLGLSLWSYHPTDPSWNSIGRSLSVHNYCGYIGSFLADLCYQVLGLGAWILVLGAANKTRKSFKGIEDRPARLRWLWVTLLLVTGSSLLAHYGAGKVFFEGQIRIGGWLGQIVSQSLTAAFNSIGVQVLLWTGFMALVVFYTEKTLSELSQYPLIAFGKVWDALKRLGFLQNISKKIFSGVVTRLQQIASSAFEWASEQFLKTPELATAAAANREQNIDLSNRRFLPLEPSEFGGIQTSRNDEVETESSDLESTAETTELSANDVEVDIGSAVDTGEVGPDMPEKKRRVVLKKKIQRRIENWELPKISLLDDPPFNRKKVDEREIRTKVEILINKLQQFGVNGEVTGAKPGPAVTMFEFKPNADVKISKITDLADDLSLALSAESVRIIAPIPGRDVVGIETSNTARETVFLKEILANEEFWADKVHLPLAVGCEADGSQKVVDLRKLPHLLVAGTTGSGKSVFIVSMLTGLLFRHSPKTLRMILIDPKQVDLAAFVKIPHLLMPPIREPKKALGALRWAIKEMDKRYRSMHKFGARDLESFNKKVKNLSTDEIVQHEEVNLEENGATYMSSYYYTAQPYIVIVCEEFGDLMAVDKQNVEQGVVRLAQMARACGIHLILAMQSPRKDVVTGLIKTNIPGRVSFKVNSKMDSRIILDESGGERLLSRGDMLFVSPGTAKPERTHGPWVTDGEIERVTRFWMSQAEPEYDPVAMKALEGMSAGEEAGFDPDGIEQLEFDERYDEVLSYVSTLKEVSASLLQRKFRLGYPRAARMIEVFESEGVVGPSNGSKPRQVLVNELK